MPEFIEKEYKSIINKMKFIDNWFWCRYTINPYNGCLFGCIYCDSRSSKYHMPEDFENTIYIKKNVNELLDKRISKARTFLKDVVGIGGVTDSYQPAEKIYFNTKKLLEVLHKHQYSVHLITKSDLVLRDIDLLGEIGKNNWCTISITITTTNNEIAKFLDNRAPSPTERFEVIKEIKKNADNIQTGVLLIPLIPHLCDTDEELENMVSKSKDSGADYILFGGGMTMRDNQALWFLKHLVDKYPNMLKKYESLYKFTYEENNYNGRYTPDWNYFLPKHLKLFELCEKYNLPWRIKRYIPNDFRKSNYLVSEKLLNEAYRNQMTGKAWEKIYWAGHNIQNLTESIIDIAKRGELNRIRNVYGPVKMKVEELLSL